MKYVIDFFKQLLIGVLLLASLSPQAQSTFTVTNTNDSGAGSLRQAMTDANGNGDGLDIINFSEDVSGTILLNSQLPVITTALTINGPGEEVLSVSGQNAHRILFINSTGDVTISDLTLKNGRAQGGNAGSAASGGGGGAGMGGAIFLENGNLSLHFTSLVSNTARGGNGGTFNNPSTALGGAGGAGPLGAGGAATYDDGVNGIFGSGGSGGGLNFDGEPRANGGNGGYGAGGGSVGSSGGGASGVGTTGVPGTFGGTTSNPVNGIVQSGGGGAGLGAAIFIYGGSVSLNTVTVMNNSTQAGGSGGSGASSGQAKSAGIFHYSGSLTNNGVFVSGNSAPNASNTSTDNPDFFSETGLTLVETNAPVISKSIPVDGQTNYQKADDLVIYMNENIYKTDGSAIADADLSGIITFKETNASGSDINFTASIVRNKITITPDSELTNGQAYYIAVANIEDRYGNEMAGPETLTFTVDGTAPVFTADPESGTTILGRSFSFTADEAFFDLDATDIEPSEYINVVKVRLDDATGDLVSTTITREGNTLQVSLDESLPDQLYHVTLENITDANGNEIMPQVFNYSRPAFAEAKIRVNPRDGSILSTQAIEVTFEEDYYVETAPGTFALFKTRSFSQAYTDAVLDLKLNDENGTDIIDKWSFNDDGDVLYIMSNIERNSTYYLRIANLFTADQTPVEAVEIFFNTPDEFNPVAGGGYFVKNFRQSVNSGSLGSQFSMEFIVQLNGGSRRQGLFQGWASDFSNRVLFWLNDDQLVLSILDGSGNVISDQSISSNTFDESALATSFQHVGFTHDNGTVVFYYNGQPVGEGTLDISNYAFSETGTSYSSLTGDFGSVSLDPSGFMSVDEVRIWSAALSAQVVSDWHQARMSDTHPDFDQCRNLWLFDERGGKLCWDSKNNEANYSFNPDPIRGVSNRFAVPEMQVSSGDVVLASGDEVAFIAGNGGQLQKEFTITNTGTVDLALLGEASVSDFEGRFEIDYSETELLLAPGETTSFTVTFQSNDVRAYNTFLTIPNSSLESAFEVNLIGRGVSLSNGNWERLGGKDGLPAIQELWSNDGNIYFVTSVSGNSISKLIKATISPDGNLNYEEETTLPTLYNSSNYDLIGDNSGNFYTITDPGNGTGIQVKNIITNQSESFLIETSNDKMDGLLKVDRNGTVRFVHSFSDGSAYNQYGIKIQTGIPSTATITLTMEDLRTIFGTDIGSSIFAYSIAFDSNNQLFATVGTNDSKVLVLKYDPTTGWDNIGYDYTTIGVSQTAYYVNLIIDQNDNIHVGGIGQSQLRYHKFSPTGTLLEGGFTTDQLAGSNFTGFPSRQGGNLFGLGAENEPIFLFDRGSSSNGHSAAVFEDGAFRLFNETYISGTEIQYTSNAKLSIDGVTGRPFVSTDGSNGPSDLWTTQSIGPELTAFIGDKQLQAGNSIPIQIGVGFDYEFDLVISNSGLTNLQLTGDPVVSFTGDNAQDLSFDISGLPTTLLVGEVISIPMTFAPKTIYTNSEVVVSLPSNLQGDDFEFKLVLNALDDTNTGEWSVHTDIVDPPYTDVDMRIGKNNQPVYTYNTYQTIVYPSGPNAEVTIPYARLETYQEFSGHETFDPETLEENINLSTAYPLTDHFPQIQSLVNPKNNLNHFAYGSIQFNSIRPNLFASHPVSGLSRVTFANNRIGRADFEFDENGDPWFLLMDDENGFLFLANDGEENIFFSGTSRNSKDLDLEIGDDFMYSMTQEFGQSLGYKSPIGSRSTSQGAVTFLGSSSNQLRNGNYSDETHNKDIELFDGKQYTVWIRSDGGIEFYENTTFISNPGVSNVIDLQLQIHPDGTPYIAYIEDLGANQFPVSVIKLVDGVWETVGEPRFSYGDYSDQYAGLTDAPTRPALRAAFQINDLGQLFVFYGDIYTVTEAPEAFNHPPAFTSTPGTEVNEGEEYIYEIAASDSDLDALTFGTTDLPEWLTFTDNGDGTALLSGTPTDEDAIEYSFSVTVSDGSLITTQEITLTVNDLNTQPYFDQPVSTITIDQDVELQTLDLTGLTDGDFYMEQSLSFEVVSDNEFLLSSLSAIANEDGTGSLLYQPASGESGVATITLTLLDDGTPQKSITYNIEITVNPVTDTNAIVVTNTNDSGEGSLRAAIIAANENPDHNVIDLRFIEGTIALTSSLPALSSNMDIVGTDASPVTVSGENAHQVFYMTSGKVLLKGFEIANGLNRGGDGTQGSGGGGGGAGFGGAVFLDRGNLIIDRMNFSGNVALGGNGGNAGAVNGGDGGSSRFGTGGAGGAVGNFDTHGAAGASGVFYGTGGGGGEKGFSGFSGGKGGDGNFGGGAGGGAGVSSGSSYGNPGNAGTFGGNGGKANNGGAGGGGAGLGGAIYAKSGNLIVNATTFISNAATGGSKGTNSGSTSVIQPTNGSGKGGAIFLYQDVAYKLTDVVYSGNSATSDLNTIGDDNNIYIGTDQGASSIFLSNTSIDENQSGPVLIGNLSTFTGNPSDVFYYTIISSSLDENDLDIDGEQLNYMGSGLDFETESSFSIQIESTTGSATNLINFTIAINDLDEPATDFDLSGNSLDEGQDAGTVVGSFIVTDVDGGENTFILSSGFGDNALFQIEEDELQTAAVLDFDEQTSYSIQVELYELVKQFTITLNNINVAPTNIVLSGSTTPENGFADVLIGTLSTEDTDDEDTHTYTIVGGTTSFENDDVKLIGNELYTNRSFDFETEPEVTVEIRSTDNGQESVSQTLTITIEDTNDVPTGIELSANTVEENVAVGTVIATVTVSDPDANDQHTLSLTQGYEQNYAVSIDGLNIVSAIPMDYETLSSLALQLLVEDVAGGLNQFEVVVEVLDLNEAPTAITLDNASINENTAAGSAVGQLSAEGPEESDSYTFSLVDGFGDNTSFTITDTGLQNAAVFNYENKSSYSIKIAVTDGNGGSLEQEFTISVNDINEAPTAMTLSSNSIDENTAAETIIATLSTSDEDTDDVHTYSLTNEFGDNAGFQISEDELITVAVPDFETKESYSIQVEVNDGNGGSHTQQFTISINDVNEAPTDIALSNDGIDEDAEVGAVIGTLSTTDQDTDDTHIYEVLTTIEVGGTDIYPIVADGDDLVTAVGLDYEVLPNFEIEVQTTDSDGLTFTKTFVLYANDINEAPTAITISASSVDENETAGTEVGEFTVTDQDSESSHAITLTEGYEDNGSFEIDGNKLKIAEIFDFEIKSSYTIQVLADDGSGGSLEQTFIIAVNDTNDAPTNLSLSANTIEENAAVATGIGVLSATDEDTDDQLTFNLIAGFGDNSSFTIADDHLESATSFDFEEKPTYVIKVQVSDGNGGSVSQEFEITVTDANEAPSGIALSNDDINEDAPVGSVIGTLSTTDEDTDDTHSYEVLTTIEIDGTHIYPIVADGDDLVTAFELDYEVFPNFEIEVRTTDSGGLTFTRSFVLYANDVNEAPSAIALSALSVNENLEVGTEVGEFTVIDQDAGSSHTLTLVADYEDNGSFEIDGNKLKTAEIFDFETNSSYNIQVLADDGNGGTLQQTFTIAVNDTNDAPTSISLSANTIDENAEVGTVIGTLSATDEDAADELTFSLGSNFGDNSSFSISEGQLQSAESFNYEAKSSYMIKVRVSDGNEGTFEQEFDITVNNIDEGESQTITFESLADRTFGDASFELTATASSGLSVNFTSSDESILTISGTTATIISAGEVTIAANQEGDETYEQALEVTQTLTINKAEQVITFDPLPDVVLGSGDLELIALASSGLEVSYSVSGPAEVDGNVMSISGLGEVIVTASQSGDINYLPANDLTQKFNVTDPNKEDQTISFDPPAVVYVNETPIILEAVSDVGLEVFYEVVSGSNLANLSGNNLHLEATGTIVVRAFNAGDETFEAASIAHSIEIRPMLSLSGTVTDENDDPFGDGTVLIVNANTGEEAALALSADGTYHFSELKGGEYYLGVIPDDQTTYFTTAYGDVVDLREASVISLDQDISGIDIQLVAKPSGDLLTGNGVLAGRVIEDDGSGSRITMGRILEGVPVEGASILLVRKSDGLIMTEVFTNTDGDFKINGVPEGTFSIVINIPGVKGSVSTDVTIDDQTEVTMTAMVGEDGIVFDTEVVEVEVLGLDMISLEVYPNPILETLNVRFESKMQRVDWRVINMFGQEVFSGYWLETTESSISFEAMSHGVYFLHLTGSDGSNRQLKVVK